MSTQQHGRYFRVGPSIWRHPWGDDTRLLAFYLLTGPHRTAEGLFRMPTAYAVTDLNWTPKRFQVAWVELLEDGFVEYDHEACVCLIVNALKWQPVRNPNQAHGAVRKLLELPETPLLDRLFELAVQLAPPLAEALREQMPHRFANSRVVVCETDAAVFRQQAAEGVVDGGASVSETSSSSSSSTTRNRASSRPGRASADARVRKVA